MVTRMNISVPDKVKKRMDKVRGPVNWSATAVEAFERKLGEIAARKEKKKMTDVIQRLRASKLEGDQESKQSGHAAGESWASHRAEAAELKCLWRFCECAKSEYGSVYECLTVGESAFPPGEVLFYAIFPEHDKDREYSLEFWEGYSDGEDVALDASFVAGFAEGAVSVWKQVESEL